METRLGKRKDGNMVRKDEEMKDAGRKGDKEGRMEGIKGGKKEGGKMRRLVLSNAMT